MNTSDPCNLAPWLRAERERACTALLAEGMPQAQVDQLLQLAQEMHAGQLALVERELAAASGQAPSIH